MDSPTENYKKNVTPLGDRVWNELLSTRNSHTAAGNRSILDHHRQIFFADSDWFSIFLYCSQEGWGLAACSCALQSTVPPVCLSTSFDLARGWWKRKGEDVGPPYWGRLTLLSPSYGWGGIESLRRGGARRMQQEWISSAFGFVLLFDAY